MAVRRVLRMGEPLLKEVAAPVAHFDGALLELVADMDDTMRAERGAGIAAPQIGIGARVVIFELKDNPRYPHIKPVPYTVLVNPTLYKDAGWDVMKGFRCVGLAIWNQSVAVVNPSMPAKTLAEFVALARTKPGQLNFGNPGTGSSIDLTAQKLFQVADIKLTNIGYKGQPPALIDLMTNLMHFEIVSLALGPCRISSKAR